MAAVTSEHSILLVDDDPDIAVALQDLLEHHGYLVHVAGTCRDAIARAREHRYNAVLLDIGLPDGDGLDVLRVLQEIDSRLPVIILTAYTTTDRTIGSLTQGAFAYLTKPYNRDELRATLRRAIGIQTLATKAAHVEHALSESEERFRSLVESATDAIVLANQDGVIISWNQAASRLFGYGQDEVLGKPLTILMPARYRKKHEEGFHRVQTTGESRLIGKVVELHGIRKDTSEFPLELALATWKTSRGSYYSGIIRDISDRRQAEESLDRLRRRHELILTQAGQGIYGLDRDGRTTFVNAAAAALLGYSSEELLGRPMHPTLHHSRPDGTPYPVEECPIYATFRDGRVHRAAGEVFWCKDGSSLPVEYVSTPIHESGDVTGTVVVFTDISERQRVESALQDSRERFRQLAEHIREVFWMTDPTKNQMIYISPGYEEIWDRTCESLYASPQSWLDAIHPDDRNRVLDAAVTKQVLGTYDEEYRIVRPDRSVRWIWDRAFPIRDSSGQVYRIAGLAEDVTEHKRVEAALHESEERYRTLFEDNPSMYFMVDAAGVVLSVNRFGAEQLGYTVEELVGQPVLNVFYESDREAVHRNLMTCLEQPGPAMCWEFRKVRKDGRVIWVRETAKAVCDAKQQPVVLIVCEDVTERKRAEEVLRLSEERFRTLVSNLPGAVYRYAWDSHWTMEFLSEDIQELCGYPASDFLGNQVRSYSSIIHPEDRPMVERLVADSVSEGQPYEIVYRILHRDGDLRWAYEKGQAVFGEEGQILWLDGAVFDITYRKRMEAALREREERLRLALTVADLGTWDWNIQTSRVIWSDNVEAFFGVPQGFFAGSYEEYIKLIHPEDRDRVAGAIRHALTKGSESDYSLEHRVLRPDGSIGWLAYQGHVLRDNAGAPVRMLGTVQHITSRKQADEALSRREELLRRLINNTTAVIYVKDTEGRYSLINSRFQTLFNISLEQIMGKTDHDVFPKEIADTFRANDIEVLQTGSVQESEELAPHQDGLHTYLSIKVPLFDSLGNPYATCGISTDITDRKRIEEALRTSEERLRLALTASHLGVWDWDIRTGQVYWSESTEALCGLKPGAFPRTHSAYLELIYLEDRGSVMHTIREALDGRAAYDLEHRTVWPDGSLHWLNWSGQVHRDADGKAIRVLGTVRDLTAHKFT